MIKIPAHSGVPVSGGSEVFQGVGCVQRHQDTPGGLGLQSPRCPQLAICPWASRAYQTNRGCLEDKWAETLPSSWELGIV